MADENEYSTITPILMHLCAGSDYRNLKQSVRTNIPPFLSLLCKTAVVLLPFYTRIGTLFHLSAKYWS